MTMDSGRAVMAVVLASLAAGPAFFIGLLAVSGIQNGLGDSSWSDLLDYTMWWAVAWMIFLGLFVATIPNAVMVVGLGLLGRSMAWARSYPAWIVAGLAIGLLIAWRMSQTSLIFSYEVVFAGGVCGLVARLCMRWMPKAAPAA